MQVIKKHVYGELPVKAHTIDAGFDITSTIQTKVEFGKLTKIPTGISVQIPEGYYGRIAPRSGLASKYGINVLAGVIDSGYTGEIIVILTTHLNSDGYTINIGDKIAQLILEKISPINSCIFVNEFSKKENTDLYLNNNDNNVINSNNNGSNVNGSNVNSSNVNSSNTKNRNNNGFGSSG